MYIYGPPIRVGSELMDTGGDDAITSICWEPRGAHVAVGTNTGRVQLWDVQECKLVRAWLHIAVELAHLRGVRVYWLRVAGIALYSFKIVVWVLARGSSERTQALGSPQSNTNTRSGSVLTSSGTIVSASDGAAGSNGNIAITSPSNPALCCAPA